MSKSGASGRSRRVSNGLVGLSSAAVLAIYGAGYVRTRPAAAKFALAAERRPPAPSPQLAPAAVPTPAPLAPPTPAPAPAPVASASATPRVRRARAAATPSPSVPTAITQARRTSPAPSVSIAAAPREPATSVAAPPPTPEPPQVATAPPEPVLPVPVPTAASGQWKDGSFLGWGSSRHGDIQAAVEVKGGRIISATIAQCLTRYSCSWISPLPPQVVARQSANVDYVSGATQSTNAFYDAIVDALSKAK